MAIVMNSTASKLHETCSCMRLLDAYRRACFPLTGEAGQKVKGLALTGFLFSGLSLSDLLHRIFCTRSGHPMDAKSTISTLLVALRGEECGGARLPWDWSGTLLIWRPGGKLTGTNRATRVTLIRIWCCCRCIVLGIHRPDLSASLVKT